jgi:hypothetical protein
MGEYGYWTGSGGHLALGDVTLSSYAPINYRVPVCYDDRAAADPPAGSRSDFRHYAVGVSERKDRIGGAKMDFRARHTVELDKIVLRDNAILTDFADGMFLLKDGVTRENNRVVLFRSQQDLFHRTVVYRVLPA